MNVRSERVRSGTYTRRVRRRNAVVHHKWDSGTCVRHGHSGHRVGGVGIVPMRHFQSSTLPSFRTRRGNATVVRGPTLPPSRTQFTRYVFGDDDSSEQMTTIHPKQIFMLFPNSQTVQVKYLDLLSPLLFLFR